MPAAYLVPEPLLRRPAAWFGLLALGLVLFHAAWLSQPLNMLELNSGAYFGVFIRNWEHFGFWNLRGLPLMSQVVATVEQGTPYVHHPPGLSWLFYALGGHEWSMRLPGVVGGYVAAICWYRIARTRFAAAAAFWSACVLVFCPCFAVISVSSYEVLVVACGLVVIAELVNPVSPRWLSLLLQVFAAFFGTWIDWGFAFMGLACAPIVWRAGGVRANVRRLLPSGIAALLAVSTIVLWKQWALARPGLQTLAGSDADVIGMVQNSIFAERTSWFWFVEHIAATVGTTWSSWLIGTFVLGFGVACWRSPRLTFGTGLLAIAPFVILIRPADYIWHTFHAPLLATTAAALLDLLRGCRWQVVRGAATAAALVVLGGVVHASWQLRANAATSFFARLGAALSDAVQEPGWAVAHNCPNAMPCYFTAPHVLLPGIYLPDGMQLLVDHQDGFGWKYLWLKPARAGLIPPWIEQHLSQFPRVRVAAVEGPVDAVGNQLTGGIAEAWLYTLSQPPR